MLDIPGEGLKKIQNKKCHNELLRGRPFRTARLSLTHAKITSLAHAYVTCTCTHLRYVTCTCTHLPGPLCRHWIEDLDFWVSGFGGFGVFGVGSWLHSFCLNTWNATDRTLSFKVWGVLGFGFWRFRGFWGFGVGSWWHSFCLNTWHATDRTLSFKVWGVLGFGFWRFRGFGVGSWWHSFCLNTRHATDMTLSFKVWGVLGFGVGSWWHSFCLDMACHREDTFFLRFGGFWVSGFRLFGVVMTFVLLQHMVSQTGHVLLVLRFYADVRFTWTHGMLDTRHWVLGFARFLGFGVICVSGRGRDYIRFCWTHGMQQTRHSWLAHAFLNCACKHFSFLPRACAHWSSRSV